jgi:hypothetical protein
MISQITPDAKAMEAEAIRGKADFVQDTSKAIDATTVQMLNTGGGA